MFLRQFKYLVAVAEERHFGRAARRCHVTQPSLSSGIKQLELEIGAPVFLRGRGQRFHGLTPEGDRVAKWARSIIAHCDAMREEVASMRNALNGKLRMGAMPSMSPILPLLLQMVRERHPGVMVDVQFIGNEAMKTGLNNFSIDVALTYLETADLGRRNTLPVYSERLSLLVPDTDEFAAVRPSPGGRRPRCRLRCCGLRSTNGALSTRSSPVSIASRRRRSSPNRFSILCFKFSSPSSAPLSPRTSSTCQAFTPGRACSASSSPA